ncbi:uncharacterized protein LAESUDRAFT_724736, partial [Laetiporus sulphureus 93-53]
MDCHPLTPGQGYPAPTVVCGYTGTRWAKWVAQITVRERQSENIYQQKDTKVLSAKVCLITALIKPDC